MDDPGVRKVSVGPPTPGTIGSESVSHTVLLAS